MKKANGIKLLTLAGLMATAACTGDFLNKNTNPDQATDEMLSWDNLSTGSAFAQMTKNVIPSFQLVGDKEYGSANYQVIEDLAGNIFAGYTGVINTSFTGNNLYNVTGKDWYNAMFNDAYTRVISAWNQLDPQRGEFPEVVALADIVKVAAMHRVTDTYGPICTDEDYLQSFAHKHRIVDLILEYRGVKKLLSTYVEALPQLVNRRTGRIHTSFNQAVTATGRLSSTNPNLQNIPVREEMGRRIRRAFIPSDEEHLLLSADYSQVELRLMAHLSGDESLIAAFAHGEDIHAATAAKLFNKTLGEVTSEERRRAKTANFGIIYGISAFGLSQRLEIPRKEAKEIIDGYFASYPKVQEYMDNVVAKAKEEGFVSTIFGRRRYLNDIASHNAIARGLAERNAVNAPIQGSAADIMKIAMINVHRRFAAEGIRSKVILQVHDELVVDMLRSEQERVVAIVTEAMESAAALKVRLVVDYGVGGNWLEAH